MSIIIKEKTYYKPFLPKKGDVVKINGIILTVNAGWWCGGSDSHIYQITFENNTGYCAYELNGKTENSMKGFWGFFLRKQ